MSSSQAWKNKGTVPLNNQRQIKYSYNWIKRGLNLAKALDQSKAAGEPEKIPTQNVEHQKFRFNQDDEGSVGENILY